ncbi:MAG: TlyA family RNA methyltransferase [Gudongella sp.]|jgi:23S rRNA (cytidine1920-2'-O)/16S rRNA (cytidine1409-2'-O)-methyltransferase|nr:TlyA family RNA methyltransferase [Gudongella sp.]
MAKVRADVLLFEKGLVESREKGKRVIMEGTVYVGTVRIDKPGEQLDEDTPIYIKKNPLKYVSRGGFKLERAAQVFRLDLKSCVCMDMGASTGGFTDFMLKEGAKKVYAVDVGYGQLDWSIRSDSRVEVLERTNIRYMEEDSIPEKLDFVSIDVSFISLKHIFPVAAKLLKDTGSVVALVKPQFEAGRDKVGKKGIVRDMMVHKEVLENVMAMAVENGLYPCGLTFSPITGTTGNIEFLLYMTKREGTVDQLTINSVLRESHSILG